MLKEILWNILFSFLLFCLTGPLDILLTRAFHGLPLKSVLRCWDSLYHGIIGAVSWGQVMLLVPALMIPPYFHFCKSFAGNYTLNAVFAFILSTVVDVDHVLPFLNSLLVDNSTGQWRRGCFHYSLPFLIPSIISIIIFLYKNLIACISKDPLLPTVISSSLSPNPVPFPYVPISALLLVSGSSHHIRDAVRHGMWLQPIVATAPISSVQYSFAIVMLPYLTAAIMGFVGQ